MAEHLLIDSADDGGFVLVRGVGPVFLVAVVRIPIDAQIGRVDQSHERRAGREKTASGPFIGSGAFFRSYGDPRVGALGTYVIVTARKALLILHSRRRCYGRRWFPNADGSCRSRLSTARCTPQSRHPCPLGSQWLQKQGRGSGGRRLALIPLPGVPVARVCGIVGIKKKAPVRGP